MNKTLYILLLGSAASFAEELIGESLEESSGQSSEASSEQVQRGGPPGSGPKIPGASFSKEDLNDIPLI